MDSPCIYKIKTSDDSPYYYFGSTKNLNNRKFRHESSLLRNKHPNKFLQSIYNKYGEFIYEVVQPVWDINHLKAFEDKYLDKYFDDSFCMNLAKNSGYNPNYEVKHPRKGVLGYNRLKTSVQDLLTGETHLFDSGTSASLFVATTLGVPDKKFIFDYYLKTGTAYKKRFILSYPGRPVVKITGTFNSDKWFNPSTKPSRANLISINRRVRTPLRVVNSLTGESFSFNSCKQANKFLATYTGSKVNIQKYVNAGKYKHLLLHKL